MNFVDQITRPNEFTYSRKVILKDAPLLASFGHILFGFRQKGMNLVLERSRFVIVVLIVVLELLRGFALVEELTILELVWTEEPLLAVEGLPLEDTAVVADVVVVLVEHVAGSDPVYALLALLIRELAGREPSPRPLAHRSRLALRPLPRFKAAPRSNPEPPSVDGSGLREVRGVQFAPHFDTSILNILPKFWPRLCEVAPWMARPVAEMYASTVVVMCPPANFSFSVFLPLMTGTASKSS